MDGYPYRAQGKTMKSIISLQAPRPMPPNFS